MRELYERTYHRYFGINQPKIYQIDYAINLFPSLGYPGGAEIGSVSERKKRASTNFGITPCPNPPTSGTNEKERLNETSLIDIGVFGQDGTNEKGLTTKMHSTYKNTGSTPRG